MRSSSLALLLLLFASTHLRAEDPVHVYDPNASFVNVQLRRAALQHADTPRLVAALASNKTCTGAEPPLPPPPGQEIPPRYKNDSHGATNPDEHARAEPYYRVQDVAAYGANRYLVTGDPKEAACVIQILLPWAQSRAMMAYNAREDQQVWYQATWTAASLSLSVSVIRGEPTLNPADRAKVTTWLHDIAQKAVTETRGPRSGTEYNNHLFWRGLAATAAGVISNDNVLYKEGLSTYVMAIGEMDAQGAFPEEMGRHELALHYQAFAIEPLVMIAELARRQHVDLYALKQNGHQLGDAVAFLSRAMADPSVVQKYTHDPQQMDPDLAPGSQLLAWLEFWAARNGAQGWQASLDKPYFTSRLAGSTTLYAAPAQEQAQPPAPARH